jgi:hypothetical protein
MTSHFESSETHSSEESPHLIWRYITSAAETAF